MSDTGTRRLSNNDLDTRTSTRVLQDELFEVVGPVNFGVVSQGYGFGSDVAIASGEELMTTNFTPSKVGSIIDIEVQVILSTDRAGGDNMAAGIHINGGNAVRTSLGNNNEDRASQMNIRYRLTSTSLAAITIAVRGGSNAASIQTRLNSVAASSANGNMGTLTSYIRIVERAG